MAQPLSLTWTSESGVSKSWATGDSLGKSSFVDLLNPKDVEAETLEPRQSSNLTSMEEFLRTPIRKPLPQDLGEPNAGLQGSPAALLKYYGAHRCPENPPSTRILIQRA